MRSFRRANALRTKQTFPQALLQLAFASVQYNFKTGSRRIRQEHIIVRYWKNRT